LLAGLAAAFLVVRMRRAGLALHRQIDAVRAEVQTIHEKVAAGFAADEHRAGTLAAHLEAHMDEGHSRLQNRLDHTADHVTEIRDRSSDTNARVVQLQQQTQGLSVQSATLAETLTGMSATVSEIAEVVLRRAPRVSPLDTALLESKREPELIAMAESIAILRPLVPFPKWQTDADLENPDLSFQFRRWIWESFRRRKREVPIVLPWHANTRVRLYLGTDLSRQVFVAGCFEPNEFAFLDRILQPGMTFLDAGANDGLYSVFAAKRVGSEGTVWAFEPSSRELERLRHNLDLNGLTARVFPVALADTTTREELTIGDWEHAGQNTLGGFGHAQVEAARREKVDVRRLDDLVDEAAPARIDVVKLDVEGAEFRLLRGALSTLRRYRPVLLFELFEESLRSQGSSRDEVLDLLRSEGFLLYAFQPETGLPAPAAAGVFSDNMVAFPREKKVPASIHWPWPQQ
jgi:FkbM family methyltransferase